MNRLEITQRVPKDNPQAIILDLEGIVDETTLGELETVWKILVGKKYSKAVLNCERLSVLSTFGAGYLAAWIKQPHWQLPEIRLLNVPAVIKQIFAAIPPPFGSLHFFEDEKIALSQDNHFSEAPRLDHFVILPSSEEIISGLPFNLRIEARDQNQKRLLDYTGTPHLMADKGMIAPTLTNAFEQGLWSGQVILTGPEAVKVRVWDEQAIGEQALAVVEKGEKVAFPIETVCPGCGRANIAGKTDIFRCIKCNQIYFVDVFGHIVPLKPGNNKDFVKIVDFKIPSDVNYLNHVRNFIIGVAREENIDEEKISQIEMSLDEALANIIEHAYSFDCHQDIRLTLELHPDHLVFELRDHGRPFNSADTPLPNIKEHIEQRRVGGLGRYLMMTLMDEVEYQCDAHTNKLKMVKWFKTGVLS